VSRIETVTLRVTSVDLEDLVLAGRDRASRKHTFSLRPETVFRRSGDLAGRTFEELGRGGFPLLLGQEIQVGWKVDSDGKIVAVELVVP
jgi:hypothetical protein